MEKIIHYSAQRCAAGKSHAQRDRIVTTPSLYILAVDRREMIPEVVRKLRQQAVQAGTSPVIQEIYSRDDKHPTGSYSVRVDIEALPTIFRTGHVVVVTTHKALQIADLSGFTGWTCCIDETPSAFLKQELSTHALGSLWFAQRYKLTPPNGKQKFARVTALPNAPTAMAVASDTVMQALDHFHARVISTMPVYVDLRSWADMDKPNVKWTWHSLWLPESLAAFDKIEVIANAFDESITSMIWAHQSPSYVQKKMDDLVTDPFERRCIEIRYFAEQHQATRKFLDSEDGAANLVKIVAWLGERDTDGKHVNVRPGQHIWMTNRRLAADLAAIPGKMLTPFQTGTHEYAAHTEATMIYSAKPSPSEIAIFATMNITREQATKAREYEALVQFANRIGRERADTRKLTVTVYGRDQAVALCEYFNSVGHFDTSLTLVHLGFEAVVRKKAGRPPKEKVVLTPDQLDQAAVERREYERVRKAEYRARKVAEEKANKAA